jgi:methylmalonyl-CoA mutase N-terminal domain/subunit
MGGAQSLHTNGMDEALAIPSEEAMKIALRTQQIILEETGAANSIDPLGGSWAVESMTHQIERQAEEYLRRIDELGGTVAAVEQGFQQRELADAAYDYQRRREAGLMPVVGVTKHRDAGMGDDEIPIALHSVDPGVEAEQISRLHRAKVRRDEALVTRALSALQEVARSDDNLMPATMAAVQAGATGGEIVKILVAVFGRYAESPVF